MAALNKKAIFDGLKYRPHTGQKRIHRSTARMRLAACGRRFGKSVIGGHELTPEALLTYHQVPKLLEEGRRREFWIVGPEYSDSEKEFRILYDDLLRLKVPFDRPGTYNNPDSGDMKISLWGGKFVVSAMSAKYPATLVGEGLSGVVLAEAAKLKPSVWTKYIRPTLADYLGWAIMTSTPEGKNWFYDLWRRGQDPNDLAWESWRMPSWTNPYVFSKGATPEGIHTLQAAIREGTLTPELEALLDVDGEIIDMARDMSEEKFNQEIGADFSDFVGRVFKYWDEETHVTDVAYDPKLPLYGACDYGFTHPFVWLAIQVDVWNNVRVLGEYRAQHKEIEDIASDLAAWPLARHSTQFYPDPAGPGETVALERKLGSMGMSGTGGELKDRLELIRASLRVQHTHLPEGHPERVPKLLVDRSCTGLIYEMSEYRYPDNKTEVRASADKPLDKDDHGPEALGRFFKGYFAKKQPSRRAKVGRASVG